MNKFTQRETALFDRVVGLIEQSRQQVKTVVNTAMVYTYYNIGRYIVEDEQQGAERAQYGKAVLKELSARLTDRFGEGWSVETLDKCRMFFRVYSAWQISSTAQTKSLENRLQRGRNLQHLTEDFEYENKKNN